MLGFVILSHREPSQLLRLVTTLNRLYDDPPIACHHDFSQADFDTAKFPKNIRFVRPHLRTGWAKWSAVAGTLRALALLYEDGGSDWFVLLSAADYPVGPADEVRRELETSGVDAFLDYREIGDTAVSAARYGPLNPELAHYETDLTQALKWRRYIGAQLGLPRLRRERERWRLGRQTVHLPFASPRNPFTGDLKCFHGEHWFTANRRVADLLLNPSPRHRQLQRYLATRTSPDECYYQTVICNAPDLRINRDNKRYAKWNGGGAHPQDLGLAELDLMLASGAHFARKFAPGDPVLDRLDALLSGDAPGALDPRSAA